MKDIIFYFLKIGFLGFGGPMAHIAMMNHEFVEKRNWCSRDEFMEGLALCNMLPGPASTQLGIYMGYLKNGTLGGILAGVSFVLPSFIIISLLSYLYFSYGALPQMKGILYAVNPLIITVIGVSLYNMAKKTLSNKQDYLIFIISTILIYFFKLNLVLVMILSGLYGILLYHGQPKSNRLNSFLLPLFLFFFKVGSFIYGGGLVVIPFIEKEMVEKLAWLTKEEFLAGIALGQITPGPVVITAAFIGYKVLNLLGAFIATFAIFLPSFIFILFTAPYIKKFKNFPWFKAFLKGINGSVIGGILAAMISLIPNALVDYWTIGIFILSSVAILKYKINLFYLIIPAGILGLIIR